jgi:two-component system NtrC family sensor kinase
MLNFARHTAAELEPVDIHQLLDEVVELVRFEKKFESCQVEKNYTAANATIKSDSQGLRQVILNCLLNSLDAMQEKVKGKKIIRLGTAEVVDEDGQGRLSISILDSGDGISRENLANVFDPFFTTKEVGKGTGLGLFVCYAIIEQLGGRIEVQNHPAGGAEVVIELLP